VHCARGTGKHQIAAAARVKAMLAMEGPDSTGIDVLASLLGASAPCAHCPTVSLVDNGYEEAGMMEAKVALLLERSVCLSRRTRSESHDGAPECGRLLATEMSMGTHAVVKAA